MSYVLIAIISHLITGVANVIDKVVVAKYLKAPSVYAFYIGVLTIVVLALVPFGVSWPGATELILSLIFGAFFVAGFFLMNAGLLAGETSRVITILGGSLPIFTFTFSYLFLNERLALNQLFAVLVLVLGIILMGWEFGQREQKTNKIFLIYALLAGLFFAASFTGSKYIYNHESFISGFFWMRMGGVLAGISILLRPKWRAEIAADLKTPAQQQKTSKVLVLINQTIGAAGFVLLNIAIAQGSATIVNALQGVQYAFIFILAVIVGKRIPQLKEEINFRIILQKTVAILLIVAGLGLLPN